MCAAAAISSGASVQESGQDHEQVDRLVTL